MPLRLLALLAVLHPCLLFAADATIGAWPQFRGPEGAGHSSEKNFPTRWTAANVAWRVALPGIGQSSPVIWGERIFLTSALNRGAKRSVYALDRRKGSLLWQRTYETGDPGPTHQMNQHASSTCCTDGELVYSFFGKGGFYCHDVKGKEVWKRDDLGEFLSIWGTAASPILIDDKVVLCCDQDTVLEKEQPTGVASKAFLLAVDAKTGKTAWKVERAASRGFSTPLVAPIPGGGVELVINGPTGLVAYDPKDGAVRWFCNRDSMFGEPMPVVYENMVFSLGGRPGDLLAVRLGGKGDVGGSNLLWTDRRGRRDLSSPIIAGGMLLTVDMKGICICYDPKSGKKLWTDRLKGEVTASPVEAGGLVYFLTRSGETVVVKPDSKLNVVARNPLPVEGSEDFLASPAFSAGRIYIRSDHALYAVGRGK